MSTLYELRQEFQAVLDSWDELADPKAELAMIQSGIDDKLDAYWCAEKNLRAEEAALTAEIENLQARKKSIEARREGLRYCLELVLPPPEDETKKVRWQHPDKISGWRWQKNGGKRSVVIPDELEIPDEFIRVERIVLKEKIADELMAGVAVPGATTTRLPSLDSISIFRSGPYSSSMPSKWGCLLAIS